MDIIAILWYELTDEFLLFNQIELDDILWYDLIDELLQFNLIHIHIEYIIISHLFMNQPCGERFITQAISRVENFYIEDLNIILVVVTL